jgi:hypothetical protein
VLGEKLELPFTYDDLKADAIGSIINQNSQISTSNEIATFWDIFEALFDDDILVDKWHFLISLTDKIRGYKADIPLSKPTNVLKIKFNSIFKIYSEHARRMGGKALPSSTLKYYLQNSKYFLGAESSTKFTRRDLPDSEGNRVEHKQVTSSYCFNYDAIGINLTREVEQEFDSPSFPSNRISVNNDRPFD